jgi:hypothetical protein
MKERVTPLVVMVLVPGTSVGQVPEYVGSGAASVAPGGGVSEQEPNSTPPLELEEVDVEVEVEVDVEVELEVEELEVEVVAPLLELEVVDVLGAPPEPPEPPAPS